MACLDAISALGRLRNLGASLYIVLRRFRHNTGSAYRCDQSFHRGLPLCGLVLRLRQLGDVAAAILQRDELASARDRDRFVKRSFPAAIILHAAAWSSLSDPRATIMSASSGNGRCSAFASSQDARIQASRSSSVVRITGMAFVWIGSTIAIC